MPGAILYMLRTGIQWNALPRELGVSTTVYDRFRLWEADGLFQRMCLEDVIAEWLAEQAAHTGASVRLPPTVRC